MQLKKLNPSDIQWNFDFSPRRPWPESLPVVCVIVAAPGNLDTACAGAQIAAVAGFERRRSSEPLDVLLIDTEAAAALRELWPPETLGACESQRLAAVLGLTLPAAFLLTWPLEIQNYFDDKQVPLKTLKPLQYLEEWKAEIVKALLQLKPTSSQIREVADLLCDLKMAGQGWSECSPQATPAAKVSIDGAQWIAQLKKLRFPKATTNDAQASRLVSAVSWPRGVQARWERHGDQAGIVIQTRVNSPVEWKRLKENLEKLELGDGFWKN